jgi:predicted nucleic acid-binding protein
VTLAVVDASILTAAWMPSQHLAEAETVLQQMARPFAPAMIRLEFYNTVHRLLRRGSLTFEEAEARRAKFEDFDIVLLDDRSWAQRASAVSRRYNQSHIYGAIYLACAEDLDAELWTCDARFVRSFGTQRPARLKLCPHDVPEG